MKGLGMNLDTIAANYQRKCALRDAEPLRGAATQRSVRVLEQLFSGLKAVGVKKNCHRRPTIELRSVLVLRFHADTPELILDDPRGSLKEFRFVRGKAMCLSFGPQVQVVVEDTQGRMLTLTRTTSKRKGELPITWKVIASNGWVESSGRTAGSRSRGHGPGWGDPKS